MNPHAKLMMLKGVPNWEAFAGYCNNCGAEIRKPNMGGAGAEHGWRITPAKGLCQKCYRLSLGADLGGRTNVVGKRRRASACVGCSRTLRYGQGSLGPDERRHHTKGFCSTCHRRHIRSAPVSSGFDACTVCLKVFGSRGVYGGTVSLGTKSTGVCTTCRDRNVQRRKRGEQEDRPG